MGLLIFVGIPLVELFLLGWVSDAIGFLPTVGLVVLTGIVGSNLTRHQGRRTLARVQEQLRQGQLPTNEMVEGVMILVAGALLITPGVLTDGVGFLLLIPAVRGLLLPSAQNWARGKVKVHQSGPHTTREGAPRPTQEGPSVEVEQNDVVDPFREKRKDPVVEVEPLS